jgi:hypothetical protein
MGLGGTGSLCMAEELLKPPEYRWIIVDLPARLPKTYLRLSILDLSHGGRFAEGSAGKRRRRKILVKFGHVVGLGSSLVLDPSRESELIGYVDNSGLLRSCRFAHGAGCKRSFRLQCTSLTRTNKVDLPARMSKGVSAHLGTLRCREAHRKLRCREAHRKERES